MMIKWYKRKSVVRIRYVVLTGLVLSYALTVQAIWTDYRIVNQETLATEHMRDDHNMSCWQEEAARTFAAMGIEPYNPVYEAPPRKPAK